MSKRVLQPSPDGRITLSMEILNRYSHYSHLRVYMTTWGDGTVSPPVLQGHNGKKWVRVKAKVGDKV